MIRLVVNAQEFGRASHLDQAILTAHRDGIVTSTSIVGNTGNLGAARDALLAAPRLGLGLALALVGGAPVAAPETVPSLLTTSGSLRSGAREFALDWFKNLIVAGDVEREVQAQVMRARTVGLTIDHLCVGGHLGFLPGVGQVVEAIAKRFNISGIRSSVEPPMLSWFVDPGRGLQTGVLAGLSWLTRRRLGSLRHGPRTWGYSEAGRLDEVRIMEIVGRLAPGMHELLWQPQQAGGGGDESASNAAVAEELRALTSAKVKTALASRAIVLCRWQDLF